MQHNKEPKVLCKKIVTFFSLVSHTLETRDRGRAGLTEDLLLLVRRLAHCLKTLIRIALSGALKLDRKYGSTTAINGLLNHLMVLGEDGNVRPPLVSSSADDGREQNLVAVNLELDSATQLEQYIKLLRLAHNRLQSLLKVEEEESGRTVVAAAVAGGSAGQLPVPNGHAGGTRDGSALQIAGQPDGQVIPHAQGQLQGPMTAQEPHVPMPTNTPPDARSLPADVAGPLPGPAVPGIGAADTPSLQPQLQVHTQTQTLPQTQALQPLQPPHPQPQHAPHPALNHTHAATLPPSLAADTTQNSSMAFSLGQVDLASFTLPPLDDPGLPTMPSTHSGDDPPTSAPPASRALPPLLASPTVARVTSRLSRTTINRARMPLCEVPTLEASIIRHLAVMHLQPLLTDFYSPDELLEYIESRKSNFLSRFFTSLRTPKKQKPKGT